MTPSYASTAPLGSKDWTGQNHTGTACRQQTFREPCVQCLGRPAGRHPPDGGFNSPVYARSEIAVREAPKICLLQVRNSLTNTNVFVNP